ncbi:MAG: aldolase/citrate lyase family protein [Pseudomonadota bacterium]
MRSLLFVPGDDERKIAKALDCAADALILDLEDAVAPQRKAAARDLCASVLRTARTSKTLFVRMNALDTSDAMADLSVIVSAKPFGIVLPKCRHAQDVRRLAGELDTLEAETHIEQGATRILSIATETAGSLFGLGTYAELTNPRLFGMMWGGEDLAADIGAIANRDASGCYTAAFELARALCLLGAAAASVLPPTTGAPRSWRRCCRSTLCTPIFVTQKACGSRRSKVCAVVSARKPRYIQHRLR